MYNFITIRSTPHTLAGGYVFAHSFRRSVNYKTPKITYQIIVSLSILVQNLHFKPLIGSKLLDNTR